MNIRIICIYNNTKYRMFVMFWARMANLLLIFFYVIIVIICVRSRKVQLQQCIHWMNTPHTYIKVPVKIRTRIINNLLWKNTSTGTYNWLCSLNTVEYVYTMIASAMLTITCSLGSVVRNSFKKYLSNYSNTFKIMYLKYFQNTIYSTAIENYSNTF